MSTNLTDRTLPNSAGIPSNSPKCPPIDCKVNPLMQAFHGHKGVAQIPDSPESDYAESALQGESSLDEMVESTCYPGISKAPASDENQYKRSSEDPPHSPSEELEESSEMVDTTFFYEGIDEASAFDISQFNISPDDSAYPMFEELGMLLAQGLCAS
ncbi:unnamed protein product [Rhizoctonia solani]|uniref:Uncharacterized protein n=1 Tax=Rhizoctonia solani TaxID=456999 RepID=A0A8H3B5F9_9AGAM|nr:unnamed protein product [Rhizoctonia solani]